MNEIQLVWIPKSTFLTLLLPKRNNQPDAFSPFENHLCSACASLAAISFAATQTQIESQPQSPSIVTSSGSIGYQSQATPSLVVPVQSLPSANANGAYQSSAIGSGSASQPNYNTQVQTPAAGVIVSQAPTLVASPAPSIASASAVPFTSVPWAILLPSCMLPPAYTLLPACTLLLQGRSSRFALLADDDSKNEGLSSSQKQLIAISSQPKRNRSICSVFLIPTNQLIYWTWSFWIGIAISRMRLSTSAGVPIAWATAILSAGYWSNTGRVCWR